MRNVFVVQGMRPANSMAHRLNWKLTGECSWGVDNIVEMVETIPLLRVWPLSILYNFLRVSSPRTINAAIFIIIIGSTRINLIKAI